MQEDKEIGNVKIDDVEHDVKTDEANEREADENDVLKSAGVKVKEHTCECSTVYNECNT